MATVIEKILSRHAGKKVHAGDIVDLMVDVRAARDFGGANVIKNLLNHNLPIHDTSKTIFTFDCNPTGSDQKYAANQHRCRQFARKHQIRIFDIDQGIGTHLIIDKGLVGPEGTRSDNDDGPFQTEIELLQTRVVVMAEAAAIFFRPCHAASRIPQRSVDPIAVGPAGAAHTLFADEELPDRLFQLRHENPPLVRGPCGTDGD